MQNSKLNCSYSGYAKIAQDYDKGRPDYPQELLSQLISKLDLSQEKTVLDLAAGTGKVTKALQPLGLEIIAVEPVEEMCRVYSEQFPGLSILQGTAEEIPLESDSIDLVFVGTAFHWFDGEKALPEISRVLKPGGKLVLLWNMRDFKVQWVQELSKLTKKYERNSSNKNLNWKQYFDQNSHFGKFQNCSYSYTCSGTIQDIFDRIYASKVMGLISFEERQALLKQAQEILENYLSADNQETIEIPYRTEVYWCEKINQ